MMEGAKSTMVYLICFKNFCKCPNVPPPSTTMKKEGEEGGREGGRRRKVERKDRSMNLPVSSQDLRVTATSFSLENK
jgi:hypothetical protein